MSAKNITECDGYKSLLAAVEKDEKKSPGFHDYQGTLQWAVVRAEHYARATGLEAADLLDRWEKDRNYWYMNYYQESNMPKLDGKNVRVFDTIEQLLSAVGKKEFRCPVCRGISSNPYECNVSDKCDWKSYGFLGTAGKGVWVFVKSALRVQEMFMPVSWESTEEESRDEQI